MEATEAYLAKRKGVGAEGEDMNGIGHRSREDELDGGVGSVAEETTVVVKEGLIEEEWRSKR